MTKKIGLSVTGRTWGEPDEDIDQVLLKLCPDKSDNPDGFDSVFAVVLFGTRLPISTYPHALQFWRSASSGEMSSVVADHIRRLRKGLWW